MVAKPWQRTGGTERSLHVFDLAEGRWEFACPPLNAGR